MNNDTGTKPSSYLVISVVLLVTLFALGYAYFYAEPLAGMFKLPMPR